MEVKARRTSITVIYKQGNNSKDISEDIAPFIIEVDFTDNLSDEADELRLKLDDSKDIWLKSWLPPEEGDQLEVSVKTLNRISENDGEEEIPLGSFEIVEVEVSPHEVELKCVSIIGQSSLRNEKRNQTWEKVTLKQIASEIANRNGLTLIFDGEEKEEEHIEQSDESDLEFLLKQAKSEGMTLKVTPSELIMVDEEKYEAKAETIEVKNVYKREPQEDIMKLTWLKNWRFRQKTHGIYDSCTVKCVKNKEKIEGTFKIREGKRILHVKEQAENQAEAEKKAKKKLRDTNKNEVTGDFSTLLNFNFIAGNTIRTKEFGCFDGKYIIERVNHKIKAMETEVQIRRCLDGY